MKHRTCSAVLCCAVLCCDAGDVWSASSHTHDVVYDGYDDMPEQGKKSRQVTHSMGLLAQVLRTLV